MPIEIASQVHVRRLQRSDQPLLEKMYDMLSTVSAALGLPPRDPERRRIWIESFWEGANLGAFVEGKLVGHAALFPIEDAGELMVFVQEEYRRCGFATALARDAVEEARATGYRHISVFIDTHNNAARLGLLKFGFRPIWEDLQEAEYVYQITPEG